MFNLALAERADYSVFDGLPLVLLFCFVFGIFFYLYYAVTLMIIARKTNTSGAALAWIPILNIYLMCQIGRRSAGWMLLCFIPLINLFALAVLWMSIAEICGKSVWTGAIAIIPLVGFVIPAYLAFGAITAPALSIGARNCQSCGGQIVADETFCRNCGESAMTMVALRRTSVGKMVLLGGGTAFSVLLIFGIFGWVSLASVLAYSPPERNQPEIPERTKGTLTEFPVDTEPNSPVVPESVVVEDLQNSSKSNSATSNQQIAKRLPPGVNRDNLKRRGGTTLTSTVYRPRKKAGQPSTPTTPVEEIYICVLRITPGQADSIAVDVVKATNGNRTGTRVQSPRGGTYSGSKIQTPQTVIYVLEKQSSDTIILIYSPNQATHNIATRLAGNVGNGEGLNDYPETKTTIWTLPQQKPSDLVLIDFQTLTRAELGLSDNDLKSAGTDKESREFIEYFSQFIPEKATHARYQDSSKRDWEVVIYDYQSAAKAWNLWMILNWTVGFSGQKIPLKHGNGIYADTGEGRALLFQKGPYLIYILAPNATAPDKIVSLGDGVQV